VNDKFLVDFLIFNELKFFINQYNILHHQIMDDEL